MGRWEGIGGVGVQVVPPTMVIPRRGGRRDSASTLSTGTSGEEGVDVNIATCDWNGNNHSTWHLHNGALTHDSYFNACAVRACCHLINGKQQQAARASLSHFYS
ncbi:hypothetical protein C0Q70_19339 [Pomacea canaliculata]|uniref:Uncharacterized protein n=1 Tax=Pomacea canaliculata TaxID=400727 RepID=A0A2T7NJ40_POMCA|nr:hypothetical protein C0Q70_19339 [Pomacea canaliculata]